MAEAQRVRFGIVSGQRLPWPEIVARWRTAEQLGWDSVWLTDHFITGNAPPDDAGIFYEAWTLLGGLAMATERIRFGVMVTGNTYRNPALLAKEAVTVDHISNGRLELGVGAGWWEREHLAYGYPFPDPRELVDRFAEALEIISSLQTQERVSYSGRYYTLDDAPFTPKPLQQPHIPLTIGASGPRMLALTAKHADTWNTRRGVAQAAELSAALDAKCRAIGRDPGTLRRSVWPAENPFTTLDNVRQVVADYRAAGFTELVFSWPTPEGEDVMHRFATEYMEEARQS